MEPTEYSGTARRDATGWRIDPDDPDVVVPVVTPEVARQLDKLEADGEHVIVGPGIDGPRVTRA